MTDAPPEEPRPDDPDQAAAAPDHGWPGAAPSVADDPTDRFPADEPLADEPLLDDPVPEGRLLPPPLEWLLRNRETGGITIAQVPNGSLCVFLAAVLVRRAAQPEGPASRLLDAVVAGSLIVWAVDEVVRGVNPWRRILGAAVLALALTGLLLG